MNKTITVFTFEFPYGSQEVFLENELEFLANHFEKIEILPLFKRKTIRETQFENIKVLKPVFNSKRCLLKAALKPYTWFVLIQALMNIGISKTKIIKC